MEPASLLRRMIELQSPSGEERALAEFLRDEAAAMGLRSAIDDAGNFIAATHADPHTSIPGVHDIILLGHMDAVAGHVPIRQEGDLLFGRGSVDAKGPLATFLLAAARARDELPVNVRLVVIGAVEEESTSSRGARAVVPRYTPAACVIGEPSHWDSVTIGYKGRLLARYSIEHAVTHTAGPQLSVADHFARWWQGLFDQVAALNQGRTGPFQLVQATIRSIHTDSDGLRDRADTLVAFRLPPDVHPKQLQDICQQHVGDATLSFSGSESAIVSSRTSPLARALTASIRAHGGKPTFVLKTGTSDMNVVAATGEGWPCPIVAYGPGDSALDHTPVEHISIPEFLRAIDVLERALLTLAGELTQTPSTPPQE